MGTYFGEGLLTLLPVCGPKRGLGLPGGYNLIFLSSREVGMPRATFGSFWGGSQPHQSRGEG